MLYKDSGKGYTTRKIKAKNRKGRTTPSPSGRGSGQAGKAYRAIKKSANRAKKY